MNSCASTWFPADSPQGRSSPPLRPAQVDQVAHTILIAENQACPCPDIPTGFLWSSCYAVFAHPAGKVGNFIFYDGHVKSAKWLTTLYPVNENQWELSPNPDSDNRQISGPPGCGGDGGGRTVVPPGPDSKEFQTPACLAYQ